MDSDPQTTPTFDSWAIVELMGHVRMAGRVTEETRFGAVLGRCDVPYDGEPCRDCDGTGTVLPLGEDSTVCPVCEGTKGKPPGFRTVYFSGASVYRVTPCTEEAARAAAGLKPYPIGRLELPAPVNRSVRQDWDQEHRDAFDAASHYDEEDDDDRDEDWDRDDSDGLDL